VVTAGMQKKAGVGIGRTEKRFLLTLTGVELKK